MRNTIELILDDIENDDPAIANSHFECAGLIGTEDECGTLQMAASSAPEKR
jgi:hypothetical protein